MELEEIQLDTNSSLNYIYSLINDLKLEIKSLKKEQKEQKFNHEKEINCLKISLENKINEKNREINKLVQNINNNIDKNEKENIKK